MTAHVMKNKIREKTLASLSISASEAGITVTHSIEEWLHRSAIMRLLPWKRRLKTLNLRFQVSGIDSFDRDTCVLLINSRVGCLLTIDQESTLLRNINIANLACVLQIDEAAVIFDELWRVSIRAHSLGQCLKAMAMLLNTMTGGMGWTVTIKRIEVEGGKNLTLHDAIRKTDRDEIINSVVESAALLIVGGMISLLIRMFVN